MAVGEIVWPQMHPVVGMHWGVAAAGIKYPDRNDLVLAEFAEGSTVVGVFTQNAFSAAPVIIGRRILCSTSPRFMIINSGNANACTGQEGVEAAYKTMNAVATCKAVNRDQVLPFSTGVIGEPLPADKIVAAVPAAISDLGEGADAWERAARAIMTTDTRPKGASVKLEIDGQSVTITGIAKGAGMIRPNMATMLGYIATDAAISRELLGVISKKAANRSFNRITIDGDTSTNDSCILIATGQSSLPLIDTVDNAHCQVLEEAIVSVYQSLAQQIVRDGEGATKFVTVNVMGGSEEQECLQVAYAVAHSPLIKTALFASDPNWGRIVAAIGYAGVAGLNAETVSVSLDDVQIVSSGGRAPSYTEEQGQAVFTKPEFTINIDLGRGQAQQTIWTTDLSHEYVSINADYRT